MFGTLVVLYLFLGGFGAGIMLVTAAWSLAFHRSERRTQRDTATFDDLKARSYGVGFVVLCLAAVCLLLDLGRPDRVFLLFTRPTPSILSFGSFTLAANLLVALFLAAANLFYVPFVHAPARKAAEVVCVVASLLMMSYTGVYVGGIEAVALWNNVAIPVLFVLSSLSAGLSYLFIVVPFLRDAALLEGWTQRLHRIHLVVLVLECAALAAFVGLSWADPFAHASLAVLLGPEELGGWFFVGLVGLGLALPMVVEGFMALTGRALRLLPVDAFCIVGGLILRFCVVWSGMH